MGFEPVSSKVDFPGLENDVQEFWREHNIFRRTLDERQGAPLFTFFEGPPTANGRPGIHHVLSRVFKDIIPRFKTMQGFYVPRKAGWDTHGLPVELEIERELGLKTKQDIESFGIAEFNAKCRESVFRYVKDWEELTQRIGFWLDLDDAYVTFKNEYVESLWWIFKQLWDKDLVYKDYKVTPHCPRCDTSLSSHEVAQGYKDDTPDPSIFVRFSLLQDEHTRKLNLGNDNIVTSLLVWTTTPWTLPANVGLAVSAESNYVLVEGDFGNGSEQLVVAEALLDTISDYEYSIRQTIKGEQLVGFRYTPLFTPEPVENAYRVIAADFVSMDDGTGIVHVAPAYGAEDLEVGRREGLPVLHTVHQNGVIMDTVSKWGGVFIKEADSDIIADLQERGVLYEHGVIKHTYPFCWRCDSPLIYYAKVSWYIRTTAAQERLLSGNEEINWYPEHIKRGRFGEWLKNNIDWAVSRERYWGTPMPIWTCAACERSECVGGISDLNGKDQIQGLSDDLDLHRPYVDNVTFACSDCGGQMKRELEVLDAWYDSGAMPVAQWHYPFENESTFQSQFPADFICEAVDQTRGWFYTLHALSTLLFAQPSYKNVISLGHILDENGEKMSKSRGNVIEPWEIIDQQGADALRWYMYTASAPGNPRRFSSALVGESIRRFMLPLWNVYSFFVTYANIDGFDPKDQVPLDQRAHLDRWVLSELNILIQDVTGLLEAYNPTDAARRIQSFVDDLSNWYVRRSRRRFWKSENDQDKLGAYITLHEVLVTVSKLLAPFTPFIAEKMYQNLVFVGDDGEHDSVHLADWPAVDEEVIDREVVSDTQLAIQLSSLGRAARSKANIRVRQPLSHVFVLTSGTLQQEAVIRVADQVRDELNVKEVSSISDLANFIQYLVKPNLQILGKKYGRQLKDIVEGIESADANKIAEDVLVGKQIQVGAFMLLPDEILVEVSDKEGFVSSVDAGRTVILETQLSEELVSEGLAREVVHRIQTMRREADFDIADRIITYYGGHEVLTDVIMEHSTYISEETLSSELILAPPPEEAFSQPVKINDLGIELGVKKIG
ncbi:MAG: isoleucine--tRNA ligase [SAR202 cluster bacterium]|nr:isoleucine--tRNA ligase [SAR202 cluster bacterium]|tara:strand:- start:1393 stop:4575 length:3183 start_codon:yes stop_codon:yes gene_type:complete